MRALLFALTFLFAGAAPAWAADFECGWRAFPGQVRAAFTNSTVRTAADVANAFRGGALTEPLLIEAMTQCQLGEGDARQFGQYIAARAIALVQGRRLTLDYGLHEDQLRALVAGTTQEDRALVVRVTNGERPPSVAQTRERFGRLAESQGISARDQAATQIALEYMFAQIMVEHLLAGGA